jgi:hypothetical protein
MLTALFTRNTSTWLNKMSQPTTFHLFVLQLSWFYEKSAATHPSTQGHSPEKWNLLLNKPRPYFYSLFIKISMNVIIPYLSRYTVRLPEQTLMKYSRYSDLLRVERSGDRVPVGERFSTPIEAGPGVHPGSYTMGTGSFRTVKRLGRGVDHPTPSKAEVKETADLYIYLPLSLRGVV